MLSASISTSASSASAKSVTPTQQSELPLRKSPRSWWQALLAPRGSSKVEEVRRFMLAQLNAVGDRGDRAALAQQIMKAPQPQDLWALRGDLTDALVQAHGELLARRRMTDITFMFAGLLERDRRTLLDAPDARLPWPTAQQGRSASERDGQTRAH